MSHAVQLHHNGGIIGPHPCFPHPHTENHTTTQSGDWGHAPTLHLKAEKPFLPSASEKDTFGGDLHIGGNGTGYHIEGKACIDTPVGPQICGVAGAHGSWGGVPTVDRWGLQVNHSW